MSARNKSEAKIFRKIRRLERPRPERRAVSNIDLESSAAVLTEAHKPGASLGARGRAYLMRSRADLLVMPVTPATLPAVKLFAKLASLTLVQLGRRRSKFARIAAGAKYKLAALSPDSRFRPAIQRVQDAAIFALGQANAEIEVRKLRALGDPDGN